LCNRVDRSDAITEHLLSRVLAATMTVLTDTGHVSPL
jgi:hypothetical protein